MRSISCFAVLAALLLPSSLMAGELNRGTVIMISSASIWVVVAAVIMGRRRSIKSSSDKTATPDQP